MNLRDLEYFLAIADLGHFGQAAEKCHVSQPTLSGQIKKLEETLGVKLFERTNRRVMLTEIGHQMVPYARRILEEMNEIQEMAQNAHDPFLGKFRIGAFPTLSTYVFPKIVPLVKKAMPQLRLILIEEKTDFLLEKLRRGEIDVALLALPIEDDFLVSEKLFEDEFFLAVPVGHELAKFKSIDQKKLQNHRLLLLEEGHCLRDQSLEICQLNGIDEEQDFKATGLETLRQMVKAGTGITFMPQMAIHKNEKGICYLPFKSPKPRRAIGLVWRKTTTRRSVIDRLKEIFTRITRIM